ncbi:MAG: DUF4194 domain-containing protein [Phormidium sp.]
MIQPQPYAPVILKLLQGAMYSDDPHWDRLQSYLAPIKDYFGKIGLQVQNYEMEGFAYLEQPEPNTEDRTEPPLPRLTVRRQLSFKLTYSPVKRCCDGGFSQNHFLRLLAQRDDLNPQHLC